MNQMVVCKLLKKSTIDYTHSILIYDQFKLFKNNLITKNHEENKMKKIKE